MSRAPMTPLQHRVASRSWLRRGAAPLLVALLMLIVAPARAGLLGKLLRPLLRPQGDSGSGKVAKEAFHLDDHSFQPFTVVWSPDGRFIATSSIATRTIHIWDVAQRKLVKVLELPNPPAPYSHDMAWSPDGRYLATCNSVVHSAMAVRIYATKDWSVAKDLGDSDGAIGCVKPAFSSDGRELTVWGTDLTTFATRDWHVIRRIKAVESPQEYFAKWNRWLPKPISIFDMAYVPGTHTLVLGGGEYAKSTGICERTPAPFGPLAGLIWEVKPEDTALNQRFVVYCRPHGTDVDLLAVNPDGKTLVTVTGASEKASDNGLVITAEAGNNTKVIRLADGKNVTPPLTWLSNNVPGGLAYTPDGRYLIMGEAGLYHNDHPVYIIDARTMQLLDTVHAPPDVLDLAMAPDSTGFAVATGTGVTVWTFVQR